MSVYTEAQRFQQALLSLDDSALRTMAQELSRTLPALSAQAGRAALRIAEMRAAGFTPTELQMFGAERARSIAAQTAAEIDRVMRPLSGTVAGLQDTALIQGMTAAERLAASLLEIGIFPGWQNAPLDAARALVAASQGETLQGLFGALGPNAGRRVQTGLLQGLLAGKGPRDVARTLRQETALSAVRAESISRTEILRAYRSGSLASYQANGIKRFKRLAAKSSRTCPACLALDGHEQDSDQLMASHVRDRCTVVPVLDGFPMPAYESGADWFDRQPEKTQQAILGKGGLQAYQNGTPLQRWARVRDDPDWGLTLSVRPLSRL